MWSKLQAWWRGQPLSEAEFDAERRRLLEQTPVPVFWMLGKTGSGKTSIVRQLTHATAAEIGNGYRPQTKTAVEFDFPSPEEAVVKFLDTRGLGEAGYDPTEDIALCDARTHLIIVTARLGDQALEPVLDVLRPLRAAQPARPVLLALTCLHELYPGEQHPEPDPYTATGECAASVGDDIRRALDAQRTRFAGLVDRIVPLDFTPEAEGFAQPQFGAERLDQALIDLLPGAFRQTIHQLRDVRDQLQDLSERRAWPIILTHASLVATASASPLPWIDLPVVMGLQARMIYRLAELYGQTMNAQELMKMAGALGGQMLARFALRAPLKLFPVVGQTANAALGFAYTLSLGKACCWYFGEVRAGHVPTQAELNRVWQEKLQDATRVWQQRPPTPT